MRIAPHPYTQYHTAALQFILTELDLAITFCQVGLTTREPANAVRNVKNAKEALDGVRRLQSRAQLTQNEQHHIAEKISLLEGLLKQLETRARSSSPQR